MVTAKKPDGAVLFSVSGTLQFLFCPLTCGAYFISLIFQALDLLPDGEVAMIQVIETPKQRVSFGRLVGVRHRQCSLR